MRKNKLFLLIIVLVGIFAFNYNVKADEVVGYDYGKIKLNIYNDETKQFDTQEITTIFATAGSVVKPTDGYGMDGLKYGNEVYIIDEKVILTVPTKEGYYFSGWYLDKEYKTSFLTSKVENPTTTEFELYGKWVKENPNNKTYIYGKDFYIVVFERCGYYSCHTSKAEYIYNIAGKYLVNDKEKITELPSPSFLESDETFIGWHGKMESMEGKAGCVKYSEKINSLDDISLPSGYAQASFDAKFQSDIKDEDSCEQAKPEPTPEPTSTPEPTDTTGTDDNLDIAPPEEKPDYRLLDIGISTGIIISIIVVAILIYKSNKKRILRYMEEENNTEKKEDSEEKKDEKE